MYFTPRVLLFYISYHILLSPFNLRLCGLSGRYFCKECSVNPGEEWVVPARILFNWDYQRYNVSKRAATFLAEIQHHPLLDLKTLNPLLYLAVGEVSELQVSVQYHIYSKFLFKGNFKSK